jgi:hypothetical protein
MTTVPAEDVVVLSNWACKWLKYAYTRLVDGSQIHQYAEKLLVEFDACTESPIEFVEEHVVTLTKTVKCQGLINTPINNVKKTRRLVKGKRSKFAMCLAKEAYLKFGRRPLSEANTIVTRKWMLKYLDHVDYADLRNCDKVLAIDRALFLSFIPTIVFNNMRLAADDKALKNRVSGKKSSFGGVFSLRREPLA